MKSIIKLRNKNLLIINPYNVDNEIHTDVLVAFNKL